MVTEKTELNSVISSRIMYENNKSFFARYVNFFYVNRHMFNRLVESFIC